MCGGVCCLFVVVCCLCVRCVFGCGLLVVCYWMLVAGCCLLYVVCRSLFAFRRFVVCGVLGWCLEFDVCWSLYVVCVDVRCLLFVVRLLWCVVFCVLFVVYCLLAVSCLCTLCVVFLVVGR